MIYLFR